MEDKRLNATEAAKYVRRKYNNFCMLVREGFGPKPIYDNLQNGNLRKGNLWLKSKLDEWVEVNGLGDEPQEEEPQPDKCDPDNYYELRSDLKPKRTAYINVKEVKYHGLIIPFLVMNIGESFLLPVDYDTMRDDIDIFDLAKQSGIYVVINTDSVHRGVRIWRVA